MNELFLYDKHGIPIMPGDTLKVFHYVSADRRETRYMYKYVMQTVWRAADPFPLLQISHLNTKDEWYWIAVDGGSLDDYEIVQGYAGVEPGQDYRDRKRKVTRHE